MRGVACPHITYLDQAAGVQQGSVAKGGAHARLAGVHILGRRQQPRPAPLACAAAGRSCSNGASMVAPRRRVSARETGCACAAADRLVTLAAGAPRSRPAAPRQCPPPEQRDGAPRGGDVDGCCALPGQELVNEGHPRDVGRQEAELALDGAPLERHGQKVEQDGGGKGDHWPHVDSVADLRSVRPKIRGRGGRWAEPTWGPQWVAVEGRPGPQMPWRQRRCAAARPRAAAT